MAEEFKDILRQCRYYTSEWQLRVMRSANTLFLDTWPISFYKARHEEIMMFVILWQDAGTKVLVPCFYGIFPHHATLPLNEIYLRFFQVLKKAGGLELDPINIVCDYVPYIRNPIRLVFPRVKIMGGFIHRIRVLWNLCKTIKCGLLGIKTAALARPINLFIAHVLCISLLPEERVPEEWEKLKATFDQENFREVIASYERDFIKGPYETTYHDVVGQSAFRLATPALEGYFYRIKQLKHTYNISNSETFVDKILICEEKHFSSKIAEINLCRNPSPEFPEKFFFDKSIGTLPISTTLADIYALIDITEPKHLAEILVDQGTGESLLPKRKHLVSICNLGEYKASIVQMRSISQNIIDLNIARREADRVKRASQAPLEDEEVKLPEDEELV